MPAARIGALLDLTDAWVAQNKDVRPPTALALRGRGGGFVAVGFDTGAVVGARVVGLEGTCEDLVSALDHAAQGGGAATLRR